MTNSHILASAVFLLVLIGSVVSIIHSIRTATRSQRKRQRRS